MSGNGTTADRSPVRAGGHEVVRSEEVLDVRRQPVAAGTVRARKELVRESVEETVDRQVEEAAVERTDPFPDDDGRVHTYDDGSVSIPVLEEELVVTKRVVVRERVLIRKRTTAEPTVVQAELAREQLVLDADDAVADRIEVVADD